LIGTEQFFLESFAMGIFESLRRDATHPLLRRILELITRDESRHMGFGVLYVAEWLRRQPLDRRIAFARPWLGQILASLLDRPGPIFLSRVVRRLHDARVAGAATPPPHLLPGPPAIKAPDPRHGPRRGRFGCEGAAPAEERTSRGAARAGDPRGARPLAPSPDPRRAPQRRRGVAGGSADELTEAVRAGIDDEARRAIGRDR